MAKKPIRWDRKSRAVGAHKELAGLSASTVPGTRGPGEKEALSRVPKGAYWNHLVVFRTSAAQLRTFYNVFLFSPSVVSPFLPLPSPIHIDTAWEASTLYHSAPSLFLSDGARELCIKLIGSALGERDDETKARAMESAIFGAARGDLQRYQRTFRQRYLYLKNKTRLEVQVINLGGVKRMFSLLRRHKILRLRAAVEKVFVGPKANFFWRSSDWQLLLDDETADSPYMRARETVYYYREAPSFLILQSGLSDSMKWPAHIVVVVHTGSQRHKFGVASTYALGLLRGFLLPRPGMRPGFQLHYNGQPIDPADTPETLGVPNKCTTSSDMY
ncbi:hypothetical protein B0H13DRAFT_1854790 [Mycena leptocephala]|nr:hypothetical protein B0H13DRAFT_1854790 [Mycena leptocephala]